MGECELLQFGAKRAFITPVTFVAGFYSFNLEITQTEPPDHASVRIKCALHPNETLEHLAARVIAYAHRYEEGLEFSRGLFEPKDPTLWKRDLLGDVLIWTEVGVPDKEKITRALRMYSSATFRIYFYDDLQIEKFSNYLRGSKQNWVENIQFFRIPTELLSTLQDTIASSNRWNMTFAEEHLYISVGNYDLAGEITVVSIWDVYQQSIQNVGR